MKNIGTVDRIIRVVVGLALIAATMTDVLPIWGWIGVVPLVTGLVRWCPAYSVIGMKTCE